MVLLFPRYKVSLIEKEVSQVRGIVSNNNRAGQRVKCGIQQSEGDEETK